MSKRYLVIGASAAGIGVLSKLRSLDPHGEIVCVASQAEMPNNTCLIADLLAGAKTAAEVYTKDLSFFEENRIDLRLLTTVESIDSDAQMAFLSDNRADAETSLGLYALEYDKLFIGTGTTAVHPEVKVMCSADCDLDAQRKTGKYCCSSIGKQPGFTFHTLSDVLAINSFIEDYKPQRAVVVGAGLSGIECADALAARGIAVDVIEMQSHILHRFIDAQASEIIENWMRKTQVNFHASTTISNVVTANGKIIGVRLSSGAMIDCQLLIFAIGGRPNLALAESANVDIRDGAVAADQYMKSSNMNIYVGGDCARIKDLATGKWLRSCNWPDAVMQGMNAAHGMAGIEKPYPGTAIIVGSKFFGSGFVTCGFVHNTKYEKQQKIDDKGYRCFFYEDNILKAFCMVGNVDHVGVLRKYIVSRTVLVDEQKAALLE